MRYRVEIIQTDSKYNAEKQIYEDVTTTVAIAEGDAQVVAGAIRAFAEKIDPPTEKSNYR